MKLTPALVDMTGAFAGLLGTLAPIVEDFTGALGPKGTEAVLAGFPGLRARTGAASGVNTLAAAFRTLAGAEAVEAAARGAGGVGGVGGTGRWGGRLGRAGLGAAGLGIGIAGARGGSSIGRDAATVGGLVLGGAEIGSFFPASARWSAARSALVRAPAS